MGAGQDDMRTTEPHPFPIDTATPRQMTAPEAYLRFTPEIFPGDGEVADEATRDLLKRSMAEFRDHVVRVLTVLPRTAAGA